MKKNYFDKDHPYFKEVEELMRETFCIGVLETDEADLIKGMLFVMLLKTMLFPLTILVNLSNLMLLGVLWLVLNYAAVDIKNLDVLVISLSAITLYYKDIKKFLNEQIYGLLIVVTGSWVLRWICKGYLEGKSFRQGIIENDDNSDLVVNITGFIDKKYESKFNHIQKLYMKCKTDDGRVNLKIYMEKLSEENKEKIPYLTI
jgi:hypothetical protein